MTLTAAQAFSEFCETISPTAAQLVDISVKTGSARTNLQRAFPEAGPIPLKRMIQIGSASRGTLIRPVNDLDVMAEFVNKDSVFETYRYDSGAFLQRIRDALNAKTSIKSIGARGQAVRLFYTSGAHVDIAPVFKWSGSGYALPSGDGGWVTTDPEVQAVWFSERKHKLGSNLVSLCKLARRWNAVHSRRLGSYHLDVMTASMFGSLGSNWRDAMKCFFEWAPRYLDLQDPAGHSGTLGSYLSWDSRSALLSRLDNAHDRAVAALAAEANGDHVEAKRLWRIELGEEFPS